MIEAIEINVPYTQEEFRAKVRLDSDQQLAVTTVQDSGWTPLGDHYFVLPLPPQDRFGSLWLPTKRDRLIGDTSPLDDQSTGLRRGIVVAVGPGAWLPGKTAFVRPSVGVAETVLFDRFRGTGVMVGGREVLVLAECDLQGIVE